MKNYAAMKAEVRLVLDAAALQDVAIYPGPDLPDIPGKFVVLTRYGGPGLEMEGVFDARSWQVRSVGNQLDYESSETIADAIDIAFLSHFSRKIGDIWVPSIQRVGGAPAPLPVDDADRTHFVCSYVVSVELALPN